MNSTVNSTGWIVTSESCIGSREMCTRFRRVIETTFLARSAALWVISLAPAASGGRCAIAGVMPAPLHSHAPPRPYQAQLVPRLVVLRLIRCCHLGYARQ